LDNEDWSGTTGSVLVDLYIRLRDELDAERATSDPNDVLRASIAMTVLAMSEAQIGDFAEIEDQVRRLLSESDAALSPARQLAIAATKASAMQSALGPITAAPERSPTADQLCALPLG
jgi:hypothetical protein